MASNQTVDYLLQAQEAEYFNWKCVICSILAISPAHLEEQHIVEYGPYTDVDGKQWIKCDKCMSPYHVQCLSVAPLRKQRYVCSFLCCH